MGENMYRYIPKVDELLKNKDIDLLLKEIPRDLVIESIRYELDLIREMISNGEVSKDTLMKLIGILPDRIADRSRDKNLNSLRPVINASGTIIHTNLGRSLLNEKVLDNIKNISINYSNLEYDLETGSRGIRYSHLESLICDLTGAEDTIVVNNNAAAVLLILSALAKDREVVVSRGELIEIGGSFRIPEVMEESGALLKDIGTTNKTNLLDYENAIDENTGALLKVHTSNYRILGFTESVDGGDLVGLGNKYKLPVIEDLGSGVLLDLSKYGLEYEPTVQDSIKKGIDVVSFSGDKLLGGPQAGIIVGKKKYIDMMRKHPLNRALRIDKFTIAALEETLKYYYNEDLAIENIPTLKMLSCPIEEIDRKAKFLYRELDMLGKKEYITIKIEDSYSEVGGGSLPLEEISTKCISIGLKDYSINELEKHLRGFYIPIITRIRNNKIYIDLRTVKDDEIKLIAQAIEDFLEKISEV